MSFIGNKYTHWYNQIINQAQDRVLINNGYTETHHIIPKSLGGSNAKDNLVKLTAREHFVAHWLLTKMVTGGEQKKMAHACKMMMHSHSPGQQRYCINSKIYATLKQNLNNILKGQHHTAETKAKMRISARCRADHESPDAKQIRRETMIKANKSQKGKKRLASTGEKNHMFGVRLTGENNHFFGKKHSEKTLVKLKVPKPKLQCQHCKKIVGGQANLTRWHNNNCKLISGESKFLD